MSRKHALLLDGMLATEQCFRILLEFRVYFVMNHIENVFTYPYIIELATNCEDARQPTGCGERLGCPTRNIAVLSIQHPLNFKVHLQTAAMEEKFLKARRNNDSHASTVCAFSLER